MKLKLPGRRDKKDAEKEEANKKLISEYFATIRKMNEIRNSFENATEPQTIESCIFEMRAVQSQYALLLDTLKKENVTSGWMPR